MYVLVGIRENDTYTLGMLGILNGLTIDNRIAAVYGDDGNLLRFEPYVQPKRRETS